VPLPLGAPLGPYRALPAKTSWAVDKLWEELMKTFWKYATVALSLCAALSCAFAYAQPAATPDPKLVEELVAANRILFDQGIVDGFGHVSVRNSAHPNRFLLARSMAPGLVTAEDIMEFDLNGAPIDARGRAPYLERFIHSEIYKMHPEVRAVVHSHSPAVVPLGVSTVPLRPVFHLAGFLGAGVALFEIREFAGNGSDMLIRDQALGAALAKVLGDKPVVLMRGHGSTAVGSSLQQAVFRAVYTEVNAHAQAEAVRLGAVNYLTAGEAAAAAKTNDPLVSRPYDLWKRKAMKSQ
jgi:ribulose-5-phosphate 4-epimerase/fuculose-1-phosphate aldolase